MPHSIRNMTRLGLAASCLVISGMTYAGHTNTVLNAQLDGRQEIPDNGKSRRIVGDANGRGEAYVFGIDGDPETLCYVLLVEKIQLVPVGEGIAAHIHFGERGDNGPVVAVLAGPLKGNALATVTMISRTRPWQTR